MFRDLHEAPWNLKYCVVPDVRLKDRYLHACTNVFLYMNMRITRCMTNKVVASGQTETARDSQ